MTTLEFIQADAVANGVVARSPMAHEAADAGARFEVRDGWEVAVDFGAADAEARACAETVGWADLSHLGVLEIQGPPAAVGAPALELGTATLVDGAWWCPLTAQRTLVLGADGGESIAALRDRLGAPAGAHVLDLTTAHGALLVTGPQARETIARFCALDLRPQLAPATAFRPGSVARTAGYVLCEAVDRYRLVFGAAYGRYVWTVVADAGGHLGGRAVGLAAVTGGVQSHA